MTVARQNDIGSQLSSAAEQRFCKPSVVGSNPTAGSIQNQGFLRLSVLLYPFSSDKILTKLTVAKGTSASGFNHQDTPRADRRDKIKPDDSGHSALSVKLYVKEQSPNAFASARGGG
jgi:hypothetical protein